MCTCIDFQQLSHHGDSYHQFDWDIAPSCSMSVRIMHALSMHSLVCLQDYLILLRVMTQTKECEGSYKASTHWKGRHSVKGSCPARLLVGQGSWRVWTWSFTIHHQWWLWQLKQVCHVQYVSVWNKNFLVCRRIELRFELWQELGVQASLSNGRGVLKARHIMTINCNVIYRYV